MTDQTPAAALTDQRAVDALLRERLNRSGLPVEAPREDAHIAWAQHVRAEHEATHGEAEQCGAECIVLGLTEFEDATPATGLDERATDPDMDPAACDYCTGTSESQRAARPTPAREGLDVRRLAEALHSVGLGCMRPIAVCDPADQRYENFHPAAARAIAAEYDRLTREATDD